VETKSYKVQEISADKVREEGNFETPMGLEETFFKHSLCLYSGLGSHKVRRSVGPCPQGSHALYILQVSYEGLNTVKKASNLLLTRPNSDFTSSSEYPEEVLLLPTAILGLSIK
jgi:hypothetical protein